MAKKPSGHSVKKENFANKEKSDLLFEAPKKNRKKIDLEMKMKIIELYKTGKSVVKIRKDLNLSQSTVSTILKDSERIIDAVNSSASLKATVITKRRTPIIEEMEKILLIWVEDQIQKQVILSMGAIQAKARSLFEALKLNSFNPNEPTKFMASHGWFERFKKRHNLCNSEGTLVRGSLDELGKLTNGIDQQDFLQEHIFLNNKGERDLNNDSYVSGFLNIDTQELVKSHHLLMQTNQDLTNNKLIKPNKNFSVSGLSKSFSTLNKAMNMLGGMDPNERRFENIKRLVEESVWCYKEVYNDMKKLENSKNTQSSTSSEYQNLTN